MWAANLEKSNADSVSARRSPSTGAVDQSGAKDFSALASVFRRD